MVYQLILKLILFLNYLQNYLLIHYVCSIRLEIIIILFLLFINFNLIYHYFHLYLKLSKLGFCTQNITNIMINTISNISHKMNVHKPLE